MKLFCTRDINIGKDCQLMFGFKLPSEQINNMKTKLMNRYDIQCSRKM